MSNLFFELDRLKVILENKGLDSNTVDALVAKASQEISSAMKEQSEAAMQQAIERGVEKKSADFINDLFFDPITMQLITESGNMDFSEPPKPMLPHLLKNAKPIKDGSGVYKIIPVGGESRNRPKVSTNIYDAWKQINAERAETAKAQYNNITSRVSKTEFRTATSKQNANTQWVQPAKEKNFADDLGEINSDLNRSMEEVIRTIISDYEDNF